MKQHKSFDSPRLGRGVHSKADSWAPRSSRGESKLGFRILLCTYVFLHTSCQTTKPETYVPGDIYQAKKGERLATIARRYNVSAEELSEINGYNAQEPLDDDKIIFIPDKGEIVSNNATPIVAKKTKKPSPPTPTPTTLPPSPIRLQWPILHAKVFKSFSNNPKNPYEGVAFSAQKGAKIFAAADGNVMYSGDQGTRYGLIVIIKHKNNLVTVYAHLHKALVKKGTPVKAGEIIGEAGSSGGIDSPRLHFQVRQHRKPVNPMVFFG